MNYVPTIRCPFTRAVILTVGVSSTALLLWKLLSKKNHRRSIPSTWREVGVLEELAIYPIKSCHRVELNEAECTEIGLKSGILRDRYFMLIDESNNFVSARQYPEMVKIYVEQSDNDILLTYEDVEPLRITLNTLKFDDSLRNTGTLWGGPVKFYDCCEEEASRWFSRLLLQKDSGLRLVCYGKTFPDRETRQDDAVFENYLSEDTGALQDDTSYGLINLSSVDELNSRILEDQAVKANQFRANFYISTSGEPFEEDNWDFVKIGHNVFEVVKPCQRCRLTTIDPDTGALSMFKEPLTTLRTQYQDKKMLKIRGTAPRMGLQMALRSPPAKIYVKQPVYVA